MGELVVKDNLERAFEFVHREGSAPVQALAAGAMGRMDGGEVLAQLVAAYQNSDGGWRGIDSDLQAPLSTISHTHIGLQLLLWNESNNRSSLDSTLAFLSRTQHDAGYWDEPEAILEHDPPGWMLPGNAANQIWLTSAVCCNLLEHGREADVRFGPALKFLRSGWDGERFPQYTHTHWMALLLFSRIPNQSEADRRISQGCERFLADRISGGRVDPMDITDIAYAAYRAGPFASDLFEAAFLKVLGNQAEDGGWVTDYGDRHRVWGTVAVMFLLRIVSASATSA